MTLITSGRDTILKRHKPFLSAGVCNLNNTRSHRLYNLQFSTESPQAPWPPGCRRERRWGNGIVTTGIMQLTVLSFVIVNGQSKQEKAPGALDPTVLLPLLRVQNILRSLKIQAQVV